MKNKNCVQEPFSDGYTIFDKTKNRYILTEKYIADNTGINLFARLNTKGSANPQATVNGFLDRISALTYSFIDKHAINTEYRRYIIAHAPSARAIMQEAMLAQALYVLTEGDLSLSVEKDKREFWFDETANIALQKPLRETGYCLLYTGC